MLADLLSSAKGVRRAAQRKLEHELGIPPEQVPLEDFQFLTRIHYLAPSDGMWGEHESEFCRWHKAICTYWHLQCNLSPVDYILFITAPVTLKPNVNEVCDVKWVDAPELNELMTKLDRESTYEDQEDDHKIKKPLFYSVLVHSLVQAYRLKVSLSLVG